MANKRKRRRKGLHLTDKRHPLPGVLGCLAGLISLGGFIGTCFISGQAQGKAGLEVGVAAVGCFAMSVAGFCMAWVSLRQENIRTLFPTLSSILNGLLMIFYLFLYMWGVFV